MVNFMCQFDQAKGCSDNWLNIISGCVCEHASGHKEERDSLEEMVKFLEVYNLLRLSQEEIENLNRPITSNEIESVIKKFPANKKPGPDSFTGKFYQTFKEE